MRRRARLGVAAAIVGASTLAIVLLVLEVLIRASIINPFIVPPPSAVAAAIPRIVAELTSRGLRPGMISPVTGRAVAPDSGTEPGPDQP